MRPLRAIAFLTIVLMGMPALRAQQGLSLDAALGLAAAQNPLLLAERWGIEAARGDSLTAALRPNPLLNNQTLILTDPRYYPVGTDARAGVNQQNWYQLTRTFQWPGQRKRRVELGGAQVRRSAAGYALTQQELLGETAQAWVDAWAARRQLVLAEEALVNIDSLLLVNTARERLGAITTLELERTRMLRSQYELRASMARQEAERATRALALLVGSASPVAPDTAIAFRIAPGTNADSLLRVAQALRPDRRMAQAEMEAATADAALQEAARWPAPELGGIYNPQNTIPYWGFYGTLELPLFARNQGEVRRAQAEINRARERAAAIDQRLPAEVSRALALYAGAASSAAAYTDAVRRADAVLATTRYAYRTGGTTLVDLLEAQRSWLETRQEQLGAEELRARAYIDLLTATGLIGPTRP